MYLSGLTSGPLLQISLLQNVPCVLNRPRCDFLQSCREQSKALGFPVHAVPLHCATHMHMKSKWRGTDPSRDLAPSCEASLQRHHTTYVSPENCVPPTHWHFEGVLGPMLQPSPMRGRAPSCRRQNRAQQHPNANSLGASSVPSLSGGLPHNQHIYCARYRVLPSPCADTTQLKLRSYSQSWLQVPEAVLKETPCFSQLRRPVPRGLRPLQLLGLLPSPGPPAKAPLVAGGLWQQAGSAQVHGLVVPLANTWPNSAHGGSLPLAVLCIALAAARPRRWRGREAPEPGPAAVVSPFSAAHLLSS